MADVLRFPGHDDEMPCDTSGNVDGQDSRMVTLRNGEKVDAWEMKMVMSGLRDLERMGFHGCLLLRQMYAIYSGGPQSPNKDTLNLALEGQGFLGKDGSVHETFRTIILQALVEKFPGGLVTLREPYEESPENKKAIAAFNAGIEKGIGSLGIEDLVERYSKKLRPH